MCIQPSCSTTSPHRTPLLATPAAAHKTATAPAAQSHQQAQLSTRLLLTATAALPPPVDGQQAAAAGDKWRSHSQATVLALMTHRGCHVNRPSTLSVDIYCTHHPPRAPPRKLNEKVYASHFWAVISARSTTRCRQQDRQGESSNICCQPRQVAGTQTVMWKTTCKNLHLCRLSLQQLHLVQSMCSTQ